MSIAVILGSNYQQAQVKQQQLELRTVATPFGEVEVYRYPCKHDAYVIFRNRIPHYYLSNQIPYQAHIAALSQLQCQALLVTSSVGVLNPELPLNAPLVLTDLLMPDNRLPDGSMCTMFIEPSPAQGHLVINESVFSAALSQQLRQYCEQQAMSPPADCVFAYVPGPRTKTAAENNFWYHSGADVNSMTLAPEVILANELQIPVAGLAVGHKYSTPLRQQDVSSTKIQQSLVTSQAIMDDIVSWFLENATPPAFQNYNYIFK